MKKHKCPTCSCNVKPPPHKPSKGLPGGLLIKFLAVSLLVHALFVVRGCGGGGSGEGNGMDGKNTTFVPKSPVTIDVPEDLHGDQVVKPKKTHKCKGLTYGGIGVHIDLVDSASLNDFKVSDVAPGYLGDVLGLKPGYRVKSTEEIKGEPGTETTITIYPNDGKPERTVRIARDTICYEENP